MSVDQNSTVKMLKEIKTSFSCFSISLLEAGTFMVSTYNHRNAICTIDVDGNEGDVQHQILPDKIYKVDMSACTVIPSNKTVFFTDREQHTVYMCDMKSGKGRVITHDKIQAPKGIYASLKCDVFVCSMNTDSIVQLSLLGDVIASHKADMRFPSAVSVSRDGSRLVVSNCAMGQTKMKLFNIVY